MIRVQSDLRRQIEGHRQPGGSVREQILVALVRLLGIAHAGVLTHGPQAAAVHGGLHAAGIGELSGIGHVAVVVPGGKIGGRVEGTYGDMGRRLRAGGGGAPFVVRYSLFASGCSLQLLALRLTLQNELRPNQAKEAVKHMASTNRPGPAAWLAWYLPYSRMPAMAPIPAIARKMKPVTSSQSWCRTWPKELAVARIAFSNALPVRLRP